MAIERAYGWYKVAKEQYGESISGGSLYLITGFYKAKSWSLASFNDATTTESRHIKVTVVPQDAEGIISRRDWDCTFNVEYRDGPGPGPNGNENQAVFIRGFKIAVRDDILGWLSQTQEPEVQPVPAVRPRKRPCGFAMFLMRVFCKKNTPKPPRGEGGGARGDPVPALSQVGITSQFHIFSMTEQLLALSSFRYYQPIPIESGLDGEMSIIVTQANLFLPGSQCLGSRYA